MRVQRKILFTVMVLGFLAMMGACNSTEKDELAENKTDVDEPAALEGSVVLDGSGTVYPLMATLAEMYMEKEDKVSVEVSRSGTGAGFGKFLVEDGTDFNNASREMKEEEQAIADELGMEIAEFKVALDGLTFVIHPDNDWAEDLTAEELIRIFHHDGGVMKWSDIRSTFPDEEINPMGPNENHGTYEFFYENILNKEDLVDRVNLQQEYSTLVNLVSEDVNGIAFFGYGYYVNNKDKVKAVRVDFGDGPVEPSLETIAEDGDYAEFTRPVFTYLNIDMAKEKPQVLDYALHVMNNVNEAASLTGFAPLPEEDIQSYTQLLEDLK